MPERKNPTTRAVFEFLKHKRRAVSLGELRKEFILDDNDEPFLTQALMKLTKEKRAKLDVNGDFVASEIADEKVEGPSHEEGGTAASETKATSLFANFYETDDYVAEMVFDGKVARWAVFDKASGAVSYRDFLEEGGVRINPDEADELIAGVVRLPSEAAEYESRVKLLGEVREFIHRWVDVPQKDEAIAAYYVLLTWIYDKTRTLFYLRPLGDTGTGKSRFLDTIAAISYKPINVSGATTTAPVFRLLGKWRGTLSTDEADFRDSSAMADIVKIWNVGFAKQGSVLRCDKDEPRKVETFDVFGPKLIATRSSFADKAAEARCWTIVMQETEREDLPRNLTDEFDNEALALRNKLLMFRFKERDAIDWKSATEADLGQLEPRLKQVFAGLAVLFWDRPEMMAQFRELAAEHQKELVEERAAGWEGTVLHKMFELLSERTNVSAKDIADEIGGDVNARSIGKVLRSVGIKTNNTRIEGRVKRVIQRNEKLFARLRKRYGVEFEEKQETLA